MGKAAESKLLVRCFSISLDGYGAGPSQDRDNPVGAGGMALHQWLVATKTFQTTVLRKQGGTTGPDDGFVARGFDNIGAWIMGRNMFGPERGPWTDDSWKGWWGDEPPYRCPVFVLTHHPRPSIEMKGGTVFHFVTDGIHVALRSARKAAGSRNVRLGGGVSTVRQYLRDRLIDELHVVVVPVLLGRGENLFGGLDLPALGYRVTGHVTTPAATHVVIGRGEEAI